MGTRILYVLLLRQTQATEGPQKREKTGEREAIILIWPSRGKGFYASGNPEGRKISLREEEEEEATQDA